jgi:hypothetical protein
MNATVAIVNNTNGMCDGIINVINTCEIFHFSHFSSFRFDDARLSRGSDIADTDSASEAKSLSALM